MSFDEVVSGQGGAFTRDQALGAHSLAEIRSRLRRGRWRTTDWRGVYVDARYPDDVHTRIRAAALWTGGDLVACRSTAALLWGFDIRLPDVVRTDDLHFLGPADLDNRRLPGLQVHPSCLGTDDAELRRGLWCTPAARTACDIARSADPIDVLATLDAALASRRCTREQLARECRTQRGLRGVRRVAELVPLADRRAESPMESRMRWRFLQSDLPAPEVQLEVARGSRRHRLDLGWRRYKVGAEFDGLEAHMTRQQLADDRDRHNFLTEEGWLLLHFTAGDVYRRSEEMVAAVGRHLR
jgi:very-short-patch-repair endonuclease